MVDNGCSYGKILLPNALIGYLCEEIFSSIAYWLEVNVKSNWVRALTECLFFFELGRCKESYKYMLEQAYLHISIGK